MTDKAPEDTGAAIDALWSHLSDERVGLLWVKGTGQHPQPMTLFADQVSGAVWFITSSQTDLFAAIGDGAEAGLTVQADNNRYFASLTGRLDAVQDEAKLDELWNVAAAAWFDDGRDDPALRLVRFRPAEASVWSTQGNMVMVGLKMMRAAMADGESHPDIGTHDVFRLDLAA